MISVEAVANAVGVNAEALTMLLAILLGFPISYIYRTHMYNRPRETQLTYFALCGAAVMLFVCGELIWHSILDITVAWLMCTYAAGYKHSTAIAFTWFLGHLLVGYWVHETHEYDINWTTPHCILTLRMIGLIVDVYDGHQQKPKEATARDDPKTATAIDDQPTLLEIAAYAYFPTACLAGPQFPLVRLRRLIAGKMFDPKTGRPWQEGVQASLKRLAPGIIYLLLHMWGHAQWPSEYMYSQEFVEKSYLTRVWENFLWFRFIMMRYMAAWCLIESANILNGISYNENSVDQWDGVRDFHISRFELGYTCQSMIDGFNYNTNQWAGRYENVLFLFHFACSYVFRRLRWLGNKNASHVITLSFLAIWHGIHLGYYMLFLYEFACVRAEQQMLALVKRVQGAEKFFAAGVGFYIKWTAGHVTLRWATSFGFLTFGLVKKEKWWISIKAMYFSGYWIVGVVWPIMYVILARLLPRSQKPSADHISSTKVDAKDTQTRKSQESAKDK